MPYLFLILWLTYCESCAETGTERGEINNSQSQATSTIII